MRFERQFAIDRPSGRVWEMFKDIPAVADCLPGAELIAESGAGTYRGRVSARLGPMTLAFEGDATLRVDEATRTMRIEGKGIDRRAGSSGRIALDLRVGAHGVGTVVTIDADIVLTGSAAQFGRPGLIEELASRLIDKFVQCLEGKLDASTTEEAAGIRARASLGPSLILRSVAAWIGGVFKRLLRVGRT